MMMKGDGSMDERQPDDVQRLKCPDCRAQLKKRRGPRSDKCELVCGGCGRIFDVCDRETLDALKNQNG
jgi:hypothetical protein